MQQRVLLALYGNDKVTLRKLIELTKSSTAPVNNAIKILKERRLVEEIEETRGRFRAPLRIVISLLIWTYSMKELLNIFDRFTKK